MLGDFDLGAVLTQHYLQMFWTGVYLTFSLFVVSWICSFALGALLAVLASSDNKAIETVVAAYVAYHRNVPILVQLMLWYFGLQQLMPFAAKDIVNRLGAEFCFSVIALSLCSAAYISENLRSGLRAIPKTQYEAARAMGFTRLQAMRWAIVPQAWRLALPSLINDTLGLFKGTSIAAVIGVGELTYQTRQIESETFRVFEVFTVASIVYFAVTIPLMLAGNVASKRTAIYGK